jgi:potassium/hydrogen antiporter
MNKIRLEYEGLYSVFVLAFIFFTYSAADFINGNGFLAVYLSALVLGKHKIVHKSSLIKFYDGLAWLVQIIMFLILGLLVFPKQVIPVMGIGIIISLFLILVARPLTIFALLSVFDISFKKKLFISWVGLRGAVPIVFATFPIIEGVPHSDVIFNIVFFIVIMSVILQGTTIPFVAKALGVYHYATPSTDAERVKKFPEKIDFLEIEIPEGSPMSNKTIVEAKFPKDTLVVIILREKTYLTPSGKTILKPGDKLYFINPKGLEAELKEKITGTKF